MLYSSFTYTTTISTSNPTLLAGCLSTLASGSVTEVPYYVDSSSSTLSVTTVTGPLTMWAQPMQFAYQQKDLALFITSTSTSSTSAPSSTTQPSATLTPITSTTSIPSSSQTSQSQVSTGADGLSRGGAAGVAVASTLVAISLLALAIFLLWRRRSKGNTLRETSTRDPTVLSASRMQDASHQPRIVN